MVHAQGRVSGRLYPAEMLDRHPRVCGIELGGTKVVCAIGRGPGSAIEARVSLETGEDSSGLLARVVAWMQEQHARVGAIEGIGVASFGPVNLDRASTGFGRITTTPKPGWANTDVLAPLRRAFPGVPIGFDTDVNGAALGEHRWGGARGIDDFVYITIGTGVGGAAFVRGMPVHGLMHPEMGHMLLPTLPDDGFQGACRIHGRCWEGLCSGPAIAARCGCPAESLAADHPAWEAVTRSVGEALATLTLVLSPRRIIVGGSVRKAGRLGEEAFFRRVRDALARALGGYIAVEPLSPEGLERFVVAPHLGDDAGVCGAFALAQDAAARRDQPPEANSATK